MATTFELPELGEGVESADVAEVLVSEGDEIEAEQIVMELETDKAVADLPCPHAGRISKIHVSDGDTVKIGDQLLTVEDVDDDQSADSDDAETEGAADDETSTAEQADEQAETGPPDEESAREESQSAEATSLEKPESEKQETEQQAVREESEETHRPDRVETDESPETPVPAGPATRRLARKLDVELEQTDGSGPGGRITQEDVVHQRDAKQGERTAEPELPDFSPYGDVERQRLTKIRQQAAEHLARSARLIPQVTQHALADITGIEQDRQAHNNRVGETEPQISLTALAAKAAAAAVQDFPRFNASFDGLRKEVVLKDSIHIGIAVATENGLLVPVIREPDRKSVTEIAGELLELAEAAHKRELDAEQMRGATFTISNQGPVDATSPLPQHLGGVAFTPIVPWPQVAILGLSRARQQMEVIEGKPEVRLMLPLSLSYDHRVIDGAEAVQFSGRLCELLSRSFELAIDR